MKSTGDLDSPDAEGLYAVLQYVRPLHRHVAQAVADRLVGSGVTVAARAVLERLCLDGPQTVPQVGQVLSLPRQAVQRVVDDLLALGLVVSRPNPAHRRSHLIAPTPAGERTLRDLRTVENAFLTHIAAELDAADVDAALRVLEALTRHFRELVATHRATGASAPDQTASVDAEAHGSLPPWDEGTKEDT